MAKLAALFPTAQPTACERNELSSTAVMRTRLGVSSSASDRLSTGNTARQRRLSPSGVSATTCLSTYYMYLSVVIVRPCY